MSYDMWECPNCGRKIRNEWDFCPHCHTQKSNNAIFSGSSEHSHPSSSVKSTPIIKKPQYEYATERIPGIFNGLPDIDLLNNTLNKYARDGWRLHSSHVYRLDENAPGNNSTIWAALANEKEKLNATILIFERCIMPAEY